MYPIVTFARHKAISAALTGARILSKLTGGKAPACMFSEHACLQEIGSSVRIEKEDKTSVTLVKYRRDGSIDDRFRIMTATDMHLDSGGEKLNNKTIAMFVRQIIREKPDLVILTGDVIESDFQQFDCVQFSQMMEKIGVYWAYVFGNHETREEKCYYKYLMYKGLQYCPHCLCRFGEEDLFGYGNFAIHIKNSTGGLLKSLYLFDSGRDIRDEDRKKYVFAADADGYSFLKPEQTAWYLREVRAAAREYGPTKTMCYMHIPVPEYKEVFDWDEEKGATPSGKAELLFGTQYESVGSAPVNSGFFAKAKAEGSLQAMFAGHDHINDFCAVYDGVYLVYTQCTGYNTYSMEDKFGWAEKDCHYGVTVTDLFPDGHIEVTPCKNSIFL